MKIRSECSSEDPRSLRVFAIAGGGRGRAELDSSRGKPPVTTSVASQADNRLSNIFSHVGMLYASASDLWGREGGYVVVCVWLYARGERAAE